ncbi:MAG: hypothetical protein ACRC2R_26545 [Xenococcaceae cyanobacterium]
MINTVLDISKLRSIICLIFQSKLLRIDRILKNTGIHKKSCWVSYWKNGKRWSTFVSKQELQLAFWRWLNTIKILELDRNDRLHLGWAIYIILKPGDVVFKGSHPSMGLVVEKRLLSESKYPEILVDWGGIEPCWEAAVWLEAF